jgi:hypothetical protein
MDIVLDLRLFAAIIVAILGLAALLTVRSLVIRIGVSSRHYSSPPASPAGAYS